MNNARLTCTREQKSKGNMASAAATVEIGSWPIEEILWFFGSETKRKPPFNYNVTFIERGKAVERSKDQPHFGRTVSFESREFFIKWIATMLVNLNKKNTVCVPSIESRIEKLNYVSSGGSSKGCIAGVFCNQRIFSRKVK